MVVNIVGVARRLGSTVIKASEIEELFEREPGTILGLSGVSQLHKIAPDEDLVSLSAEACLEALAKVDLPLAKVTGVFTSCNPTTDYLIPSLAPLVAAKLGLSHLLAMNIAMGCAGGVQALQAAYNQLVVDSQAGKTSYYLVIAGDHTSRMLDKASWKTAILFSDGVTAAVVTNDPTIPGGFAVERVASETYAGESVDVINLPNALALADGSERAGYQLHMRGRGVFEFGTRIAPRVRALSGLECFKNVYIIPHQANIRMLNELVPAFEVEPEQLYTDGITRIGNISGAACFLGLEDVISDPSLRRGAPTVLLCAFGAELQVAAAVLTAR
ncbi:MAG: 3-oxoacyl-ACP synthase III family protein [Pseudomonadota bacterium]